MTHVRGSDESGSHRRQWHWSRRPSKAAGRKVPELLVNPCPGRHLEPAMHHACYCMLASSGTKHSPSDTLGPQHQKAGRHQLCARWSGRGHHKVAVMLFLARRAICSRCVLSGNAEQEPLNLLASTSTRRQVDRCTSSRTDASVRIHQWLQ